jgi:hypothetical protein
MKTVFVLAVLAMLSILIQSESLKFDEKGATEMKMEAVEEAFSEKSEEVVMENIPADEIKLEKIDFNI